MFQIKGGGEDDWEDTRLGRKLSRVVMLLLMLMMLRYRLELW